MTVSTAQFRPVDEIRVTPDGLVAARRPSWSADLTACLAITAIWILPALVIGLHGRFPLNDDWAYAKSVQDLLNSGRFTRTEWTWIPLITHTLIGAAFTVLTGFSFV